MGREHSDDVGSSERQETEPRSAPRALGVWSRLLLSVGLALLPVLGTLVPMPGVDFAPAVRDASGVGTTSAVALGVSPLTSAYILVELGALLVPRWNRLRHGMPTGRRRLNRAVVTLALVFAAFQAFGVALVLEAGQLASEVNRLLVISSLVGMTCVMVLLVAQIERLGLVNGMLALLVVESASKVVQLVPKVLLPTGALQLLALAAALVLPVLATWSAVRAFEPPNGFGAQAGRLLFSLPASSVQPAAAAASLLALPVALHDLRVPFDDVIVPLAQLARGPFELEARAAAALILTVLLALLLQRPSAVNKTLAALHPEQRAPGADTLVQSLAIALVPTLAFTLVLLGCDHVAAAASLPTPLAPVLALGTALVLDGRRAWRSYRATPDLICVAEERRPYAVRAVLAAAEREGVTLQAVGVATTSLLRVFGPFAAIRLLCAAPEVEKARQVLTALYEAQVLTPEADSAPAPKPVKRRAAWNRAAGLVTALGALVAVLLISMRTGYFPTFSRDLSATTLRGTFEVSLVDDGADPFAAAPSDVPAGVAILRGSVPARSGESGSAERKFARLVLQNGETLEEARRRIAPWLARVALPPGRRVAWGELYEKGGVPPRYDRRHHVADHMGAFTTYLLADEPLLTAADLASATLGQDAERRYFVGLRLRPEGAKRFRWATAHHVHERLALTVDGVVRSAPRIVSEISGGYVQVTVDGDDTESTKLNAEWLYQQLQRQ